MTDSEEKPQKLFLRHGDFNTSYGVKRSITFILKITILKILHGSERFRTVPESGCYLKCKIIESFMATASTNAK